MEVPDDDSDGTKTDPGGANDFKRDGSTYDSATTPDSGLGVLRFQPTQAYSGYDGTHTFKVPIAVYDAQSDLKVTVQDGSTGTVAPVTLAQPTKNGVTDTGKYFLVTVLKPGTITVNATSGGKTVTSKIDVTQYDAARWQAGQTRYVNGGSGNPPCTQCHVNGQAIDHSPAALATVTDVKVATTITTGISPAGFPIQGVDGGHRWTVTQTEKDGLVTYLRALDPRGFQ